MSVAEDPLVEILRMWARWKANECCFPTRPHAYYANRYVANCSPDSTCKVHPSASDAGLLLAHQLAARFCRPVVIVYTGLAQVERRETDK